MCGVEDNIGSIFIGGIVVVIVVIVVSSLFCDAATNNVRAWLAVRGGAEEEE